MKKNLIYTLIALFFCILFFVLVSKSVHLASCSPGHLESIQSCDSDKSWFSFQSSGYWYFKASGPIKKQFCQMAKLHEWRPNVEYGIDQAVSSFTKVNCRDITGDPNQICYSSTKPSLNGNTVYYDYLISDSECEIGTVFSGSKMDLVKGSIEKANKVSGGFNSLRKELQSYEIHYKWKDTFSSIYNARIPGCTEGDLRPLTLSFFHDKSSPGIVWVSGESLILEKRGLKLQNRILKLDKKEVTWVDFRTLMKAVCDGKSHEMIIRDKDQKEQPLKW